MKHASLSLLALTLAATVSSNAHAQFLARPTAAIFGGLTTPRGSFGDEVGNGWHAGVFVKARAYRALDIRIDGAYARFGRHTQVLANQTGDTLTVHTDSELPFGTLDLHVNLGPDSAEYPGDNTVTPHIVGGIGIYQLDYKVTFTCKGFCGEIETVPRQKHFGLNIGAGGTIPVFGIRSFVEARYHRISRDPEDGDTVSLLTLSAGIRIR
jgi:hypothetical protein